MLCYAKKKPLYSVGSALYIRRDQTKGKVFPVVFFNI